MEYITKDSGERLDYESGMRRDVQTGKARFDLLLADAMPYDDQFLTRCAMLMTRGAEKYGVRNWELANSDEELERFKGSAFRHLMQWLHGETDEDHAAAVYFNLMAAEYVKWVKEQRSRTYAVTVGNSPSGGVGGSVAYKYDGPGDNR